MDRLKALTDFSPYIAFLGIEFEILNDKIIAKLPFKQENIGNPLIPAIHGGVIAASMEIVALAQLMREGELLKPPKTIDVSIDYLRSGRAQDMFCKAHIFKLGRRVANLEVIAWQDDENKPIAKLHGNFLIS